MVQFWQLNDLSPSQLSKLMRRAETDIRQLFPLAQKVIDHVREGGDAAVVEYARQFDAPNFEASMLQAQPEDFAAARASLNAEIIDAIEQAHENIQRFHAEQMPEPMWFMEVQPGIMAG